jgi:hypothetical protein
MRKKNIIVSLFVFTLGSMNVFGAPVEFGLNPISRGKLSLPARVPVNKSVDISLPDKTINMPLVGVAVNIVKHAMSEMDEDLVSDPVLVNVPMYAAQLMVSNPAGFERISDGALKSLSKSEAVAMQLTFLRVVDAKHMEKYVYSRLYANHVNTADSALQSFMSVVSAAALKSGSVIIVVRKEPNGSETLYLQGAESLKSIAGYSGLTNDIFGIWLGTTTDASSTHLKRDLLRPVDLN